MRLLYTHAPGLLPAIIAGFDSGGVSHGGIEFPLHRPGWCIDSSAAHKGVRWWRTDQWTGMYGRRLVHAVDIELPDESAAYQFAVRQEGLPYDWSAIFGMAVLRDWQRPDAWYCFELQISAALAGGMTMPMKTSEIGGRLSLTIAQTWSAAYDAAASRFGPGGA
jgi:hypothetical protein